MKEGWKKPLTAIGKIWEVGYKRIFFLVTAMCQLYLEIYFRVFEGKGEWYSANMAPTMV